MVMRLPLERTNAVLLDQIARQLRLTVADLFDAGLSRDEINELLPGYVRTLDDWRKDALAKIARGLSEPDAPSLLLH